MTKIERMRDLLNLPAEEFAERIVTSLTSDDDNLRLYRELSAIWVDPNDPGFGGSYCLEHHNNCEHLDNYFDIECPGFYGCCDLEDEDCPYGVDRRLIIKQAVIDDLLTEN